MKLFNTLKKGLALLTLLAFPLMVHAQATVALPPQTGHGGQFLQTTGLNLLWASAGGGGGGSVTNFSAGTLSPLFTTSVANPTTTPALSFNLSTHTANTVFAGPTTGVAAAPTFRSLVAADLPAGTGTGTVTSVAASGGSTGLTFAGSPITTSGTLQLGGILALGSGGTGTNLATTPIFSSALIYDVIDAKFVYANLGAGVSWDHATHTLTSTTPLNQVTGALTAGAGQDSFNNKIDWQWNSLGANTGLALSVNGTQAAGNLQNLFSVALSGINSTASQTTTGATFSNTHTGTNATNIAATFIASGGASNTAINITSGNINQSLGNFLTSGTITLGGSTLLTGGGFPFHYPTSNGSNTNILQTDGSGNTSWVAAPTSSTPGGSIGDVQFNSGSSTFSGSSNFNWDNSSQILAINGTGITIGGASGTAITQLSDSSDAYSLSGNGLTGISFTSGGVANNEVGMYENDNNTAIATYTFRDDLGSSNPSFIFGNRAVIADITTATVNLNGSTIKVFDPSFTNTAVILGDGSSPTTFFQDTAATTNDFEIHDISNDAPIFLVNGFAKQITIDDTNLGYRFGIGSSTFANNTVRLQLTCNDDCSQHFSNAATFTTAMRWDFAGTEVAEFEIDDNIKQFEFATLTDYIFQWRASGQIVAEADASGFRFTKATGYEWTNSSAGTLTLDDSASGWTFTGTTTTWTLPDLITTIGRHYIMKNAGSGNITLQRAGSDQLYSTTAVSSILIIPGAAVEIDNNGTFWLVD